MPAVISHYLLAERIFSFLTEHEPQLMLNHTAFLWGAYGPDIFFAHRTMPWQKQKSLSYLAKKMHNTSAEKILNYLMSYAENNENKIIKSYAFGFASHYALDSTAHPFVLYFSEIMAKNRPSLHTSVCHNDIESNLDTIFLKYEKSQKVTSFKLQSTSPIDKRVLETTADALHSFFAVYGFGNIPKEDIIQAQYDWHNSLVLLNDRTTLKKSIVKMGEKILNIPPMLSPIIRSPHPDLSFDYANMKHMQWYKYKREAHKENFFELVNIAEELSLKLIINMICKKNLTPLQCSDTFTGYAK